MTQKHLTTLLGSDAPDSGCEGAFAALDEYVDLVLRGEAVDERFDAVIEHVKRCPACLEDTEGLLEALRRVETPAAPDIDPDAER
jgi:hypothetical protein